jgi:CMP-N,N'-diacetyllegionaminic acid synthase
MLNDRRVLALITARGGSKGVHQKNLRHLGGKSLLQWTVDAANSSHYIDRLILSSDDQKIIESAEAIGCEAPFVRPAILASDDASSVDVAIHALGQLSQDYDYLVLLQPTSPLRSTQDIDECIRICAESEANSCASVCQSPTPPTWMYTIDDNRMMSPLRELRPQSTRRQIQPTAYFCNGAVYVVKVDWFRDAKCFIDRQTIAYVMPRERSMDIDTEADFHIAESMLTLCEEE